MQTDMIYYKHFTKASSKFKIRKMQTGHNFKKNSNHFQDNGVDRKIIISGSHSLSTTDLNY